MAEYKSFHYQMHQVPEVIKPNYITAPKALTFCELYSPRKYNENVQISQCEKSFWRTRDRVEFTIYENRTNKIVFVTSRNLDNQDVYRTIFLSADVLFFEVESKANDDNRVRLVRKRDKILNTDELLHKAAADYIYARLNITADPVAWPNFSANQAGSSLESGASNANITTPTTPTEGEQHPDLSAVLASLLETTPAVPSGPAEKMVVFNRLSSDHYAYIEVGPPEALPLRGIPNIKTEPPAATAAPGSPVPPISLLPLGASAEGAIIDTPGIAVAPADPTAPSSTATGPTPGPHPAPARAASGKLPTPTGSAPTTARMNMPLLNIPPINTLHAAASKKVTPTSTNNSSKNMVKSRSTVLVRNVSGVTATPHATPTAANIAGTATVTATATTTAAASPVSSAISPSSAAAAVKHNTTPTNATSTTATSSTIAEKAATTTSEKEAGTSSAVLDTPVAAPAVKKAASTPTRSRATIISRSTKVVPT